MSSATKERLKPSHKVLKVFARF